MTRRSTTARADEEFDIAVAAGNRGREYPNIRASLRRYERGHVVANFLMHHGVANDAAFGMFARRLELRLDQRQQMHRRRRKRQRYRQHGLEGNEADIDDD